MRIVDDGSHSVDRMIVFIYDIALLLNEHTQKRHPGFLIHDNIFDVDQDTFDKSLKFLYEKAEFGSMQYILTINADRLTPDSNGEFPISEYIRARFTKNKRFLNKLYQQTKSNQ